MGGEQESKGIGEREDPLSDGLLGEHVLEQAALQVVVELLLDECGQGTAFGLESG